MLGSRWKNLVVATGFAVLSVGLMGASCGGRKVENSAEPMGETRPAAEPAAEEAFTGVDLGARSADERQQFFRVIDAAPSPCGKPHSLRVSARTDKDCKRSRFALDYVARLTGYGLEDEEILKIYRERYEAPATHDFQLAGAPYEGQPGARVTLVEFFDYSCPHCRLVKPMLEDVVAQYPGDVVVYFMHFPLGGGGHPHSDSLAAAAVAAQKQGKFREMHKRLFDAQSGGQDDGAIEKIAAGLGLDMARFKADWKSEATQAFVKQQREQAIRADLAGTPGIYINGRSYTDQLDLEWIKSWIDEELAQQP
jgi:thiol-disulfide isomerase/thioredoxin